MTLKNHIHLPLSVLLAALTFLVTACKSDHEEEISTSSAMSFSSCVSSTRAMIESTEDLQAVAEGFGVFGSKDEKELFTNQRVTYQAGLAATTGTDWTYTPIKYWDKSSSIVYDFSAYAPYKSSDVTCTEHKFSVSGIKQWQKCDTDQEKSLAYDLLVADNRNGNFKKGDFANGIVNFNFKHKLAKVVISITKENSTSLQSITYTIKGVSIGGNGASYTYGPAGNQTTIPAEQYAKIPDEQNRTYTRNYLLVDSKDVFTAPASYANGPVTLYSNTTGKEVAVSPEYTKVTTYLVAPFDLTAGQTIPITVNYSTSADGDKTAIPSVTTLTGFKPGYVYNINLKVGAVNVTASVIEIQQWTDGGSADDDVYNW